MISKICGSTLNPYRNRQQNPSKISFGKGEVYSEIFMMAPTKIVGDIKPLEILNEISGVLRKIDPADGARINLNSEFSNRFGVKPYLVLDSEEKLVDDKWIIILDNPEKTPSGRLELGLAYPKKRTYELISKNDDDGVFDVEFESVVNLVKEKLEKIPIIEL